MSEKTVIIHGQIDTGNSVEDLAAVEQGIEGVADAGKELTDTQKAFNDLNAKIEKGGLSVRDYSKAIKQYQSIALQAGRTSPIGVEALKRAAEMKDELGDLQTEVKNLGTDGRKLQAALQLGGTVVSGYQAFQGVTAMLGVENEDLLKTITKLQAATSTLQAIEGIRAALEKESFLMQQAKIIQLKLLTAGQWLLNAAMSANPIGLIIAGFAALGAGIAYLLDKLNIFSGAWDAIKDAFGAVGTAIKNFVGFLGNAASSLVGFIENSKAARVAAFLLTGGLSEMAFAVKNLINHYQGLARAQEMGASAAEEMVRQRNAQLQKELDNISEIEKAQKERFQTEIDGIDFAIKKAQASGENHTELERKKLEITIARIKEEIIFEQKKHALLNELEKETNEAYAFYGEEMKAHRDKIGEERVQKQKDLAQQLKETEQALVLFEITEQKKGSDAYKKSQEEKTKALEDEAAKRLELVRAQEDLIASAIKDADERAITQMQIKHQRERDELIKKYGEDSTLIADLERKQSTERNQLADEILEADNAAKIEREAKEVEMEKERMDARLKLAQANVDATIANDKRVAENKKIMQEAEFAVANATVAGLRSIGEIAIRDQQKAQKFNAIMTAAQMALDSARAITGAVAATAGIPFPANIPAIATAVTTVLANIATAVKAFRSANVGSAPSAPSAPSASGGSSEGEESNIIRRGANGETFTNEQPQQQQQIQVSVLDSELHSVRGRNEAIVQQASIP